MFYFDKNSIHIMNIGGFNNEQPWLSSTSRTDRPYTVGGCGGSESNLVSSATYFIWENSPYSGQFRLIFYLGELTNIRSLPPHSLSGIIQLFK